MKQKEAADVLRAVLKPGMTVYTILRYVSASRNTRDISLFLIRDGEPWDMSYLVCRAFDWKRHQENGGIRVKGSGMDMGLELVQTISRQFFTKANGTPTDGALVQRWL
jgi:hypothetical protein